MVHYVCNFKLVNIIEDFFISYITLAKKATFPYLQEIFQSVRHIGERKNVCVVPHNILNSSIQFVLHLELKL